MRSANRKRTPHYYHLQKKAFLLRFLIELQTQKSASNLQKLVVASSFKLSLPPNSSSPQKISLQLSISTMDTDLKILNPEQQQQRFRSRTMQQAGSSSFQRAAALGAPNLGCIMDMAAACKSCSSVSTNGATTEFPRGLRDHPRQRRRRRRRQIQKVWELRSREEASERAREEGGEALLEIYKIT